MQANPPAHTSGGDLPVPDRAHYWVRGARGAVEGPISLERITALASAGMLEGSNEVSSDGKAWQAAASIPDIARVLLPPAMLAKHGEHRARAEVLRAQFERFKDASNEDIFGVPAGSSPRQFRKAFVQLARDVHPARLPHDAHPELLRASIELFQLLSTRITVLEQAAAAGTDAAPQVNDTDPGRSPDRVTLPPRPVAPATVPSSMTPLPRRAVTSPPSPSRPPERIMRCQTGGAVSRGGSRLRNLVAAIPAVALVFVGAAWGLRLWNAPVGIVASTSEGLFVDGARATVSQEIRPGALIAARRGDAMIVIRDGKAMWLSEGAVVRVTRDADVVVENGRARFSVEKSIERPRPFTVHAGQARVEVLGTVLGVTRDKDQSDVRVFKGKVKVVAPAGALELEGGQWARVKPGTSLEAQRIDEDTDPDLLERLERKLDRIWERFSP